MRKQRMLFEQQASNMEHPILESMMQSENICFDIQSSGESQNLIFDCDDSIDEYLILTQGAKNVSF